MAFEYTTTQAAVNPSSPTIRVQANQQASNAFKSLGDLVTTYQKTKLNQAQIQQQELTSQMQLFRAEKARDAEAARIAKAETAAHQDAVATDAALEMSLHRNQFTTDLATAGNNSEQIVQARSRYLEATNTLFGDLPAAVQKTLRGTYTANSQSVHKAYVDTTTAIRSQDFKDYLAVSAPLMATMDSESLREFYTRQLADGVAMGIDKRAVGQSIVSSLKNFMVAGLDEESMINNRDYSQLDAAKAQLLRLNELDPRLNLDIEPVLDELNTVKNRLDSHLNDLLTDAIDTSDEATFIAIGTEALENNAISEAKFGQMRLKFQDKALSSGRLSRATAESAWTSTNGMVNLSAVTDNDTRTALQTKIHEDLTTQLITGNYNGDSLQFHASQNPKVFAKVYNSAHSDTVRSLISIANDKSIPAEQRNQAIMQKMTKLNELQMRGYGSETSKQKLMASVAKVLVASGNIENMPLALGNIMNSGSLEEIKLVSKSNKQVESIYRSLPEDTQIDAHRQFSVLVAAGVDEEQAFEAVESTFSYNNIDNFSGEISGSVIEKFQTAGSSANSLEFLQETLIDSLPENTAVVVEEILGQGGARLLNRGDNLLLVSSDSKSHIEIPMTPERYEALGQEMSRRYQDDNMAVGVGIVASDIFDGASANLSKNWDKYKATFNLATMAPAEWAASGLAEGVERVGKELQSYFSKTNKLLGDLYTAEGNTDAIWSEYHKSIRETSLAIGEAHKMNREMDGQAFRDSVDQWLEAFDFTDPEALKEAVENGPTVIMDEIIPAAEAGMTRVEHSFLETLKGLENATGDGYDVETGLWRPHSSLEGGTNTLAYGHKLTDDEVASGTVVIGGDTVEYAEGITEDQATQLLLQDTKVAEAKAKKHFGSSWSSLGRPMQLLATEIAYNVGSLDDFVKFTALATNPETQMLALTEISRSYLDREGNRQMLTSRERQLMRWFNKNT